MKGEKVNVMSDVAVVELSLGVTALIFIAVAYFLLFKYSYRGGVKTTGELIGFRKLDNDHYIGALNSYLGRGEFKDFNYNVTNSKPILRFTVGERVVECHSEWSVADLDKHDIGKKLPIRYFIVDKGRAYRVILEGKQYEQHRARGRRIIFGIFAGIGYTLVALTLLVVLLYKIYV
jgi:hypothetical protein